MINYKSYSESYYERTFVHFEWICHHIQINLTYIRIVYYVSLDKISDAFFFLKYLQKRYQKQNKLKSRILHVAFQNCLTGFLRLLK